MNNKSSLQFFCIHILQTNFNSAPPDMPNNVQSAGDPSTWVNLHLLTTDLWSVILSYILSPNIITSRSVKIIFWIDNQLLTDWILMDVIHLFIRGSESGLGSKISSIILKWIILIFDMRVSLPIFPFSLSPFPRNLSSCLLVLLY